MAKAINQNTLAAIGFALLNGFLLSSAGLFSKLLSTTLNPVELVFTRNAVAMTFLIIGFYILRKKMPLKTSRPWAHILRGAIGTTGIIIGMWAYTIMPLTEATILFFTLPLFVTLMSGIILREKIGLVRIGAVIAGFTGVLIATGPTGDLTLTQISVGIGSAFFAAGVDICLRWLGKTESSSTTVFYFLTFGLIITSLYIPFSNITITMPPLIMIAFILSLGLAGLGSLLAKTQSFRLAEASLITPITYTMIIWAGLFDYFIWHKTPSLSLIIGAAIIIASNLIILRREHQKS